MGADALELDLRLSLDGRLVVIHDPEVDRTTGGTGLVREMSLARLQALDAGLGETVPTFAEVLEATSLPIFAEMKVAEVAKPLSRMIHERRAAGRVTPISFAPEALRQVRAVLPDQPAGLLCREVTLETVEEARSVGVTLVSAEASRLSSEVINLLRRYGFEVTAWTVNNPSKMRGTVELKVDGIVTDRPELLYRILAPYSVAE